MVDTGVCVLRTVGVVDEKSSSCNRITAHVVLEGADEWLFCCLGLMTYWLFNCFPHVHITVHRNHEAFLSCASEIDGG